MHADFLPGSCLVPACCCRRCLEDKAREVNITDTSGFYGSSLFSSSGFELDRSAGVIVYHC
jgi:hypothetical protein